MIFLIHSINNVFRDKCLCYSKRNSQYYHRMHYHYIQLTVVGLAHRLHIFPLSISVYPGLSFTMEGTLWIPYIIIAEFVMSPH
jgi:hypothetical protein